MSKEVAVKKENVVAKKFSALKTAVDNYVKILNDSELETEEDLKALNANGKILNQAIKKIKAKGKELRDPHTEASRKIKAIEDSITKIGEEAIAGAKVKIGAYNTILEKEKADELAALEDKTAKEVELNDHLNETLILLRNAKTKEDVASIAQEKFVNFNKAHYPDNKEKATEVLAMIKGWGSRAHKELGTPGFIKEISEHISETEIETKLDENIAKKQVVKMSTAKSEVKTRSKTVFTVDDLSKVPVEFLMIDDAAVKLAIKQAKTEGKGLPKIKGITFTVEENVTL